jgi:putative transposase
VIEPGHSQISIGRQCELVGLARSTYYYEPVPESAYNLHLMRLIDEVHLRLPCYGRPKIHQWLREQGYSINLKRVERLMKLMGLQAIYPKPRTTLVDASHKIYPYLLRGVSIVRVNHVWSCDITYIPMAQGFLYLFAIIDWYSRYVLAWELSNTLDSSFCIYGLDRALSLYGAPEIFNSDQGVQFTSCDFTDKVVNAGSRISMDGRGRALDNIFIERLWRTLKYEEVYLKAYETGRDAYENLHAYIAFYNGERYHQALDYRTPQSVYLGQ